MAVTKVTTKVLADDAVTIDKIADAALVTETEGISSNDNDTTLPTSAAVKDYVDTQDATKEDTITGAATTITGSDLTASKALVSNASGKVAASTVTDTELGYVSGVTSSIQDQFDALTDNDTTYTIAAADGDNADEEKIVLTGSDASTDEVVLEAGTGLSISRSGDKITFTNTITDTDTVLTTEQVEDIVGAMVSSNSETGITVTYDDTNGKIDFTVDSQTDENFTSALKTKLDGITAGAEVNQNAFSTIAVSGQTSVNSDSNTDTLNLAAGTGITLTTDAGTDTVTITSTATGSVTEAFKTISVSGEDDVVADGATDTLTLAAGSNITLTTDAATDTITIASTASGGGGSVDVVTTQHSGDGSTQGFALDSTPGDNDAVQVYLNGVYQVKDAANYSISGSTLTFVTPPTNSTAIEFVHFKLTTGGGGGISWDTTVKTSAFTAIAGEGYFVNTTSAAITVTLPSSPSAGDEVSIVDYAGTADTNNITITSSDNINGAADDVFINYERGGVSMVYVDSTQGWIAYNAANETATALNQLPPLEIDYLVVAGGGGAGTISAGGGAGGLRTSYSNSSTLNGHTETSLSLQTSTNYTVTIGSGGSGGHEGTSTNGLNSVFSTITSTGGGQGGHYNGSAYVAGSSGGSGGGTSLTGGAGGSAVTSPVTQGYAGGSGDSSGPPFSMGGGGGASAAGGNSAGGNTGANGGAGLAVNILNATNAGTASVGEVSGSDVYYAGGGGGAGETTGGSGAIGGGGNGGGAAVGTAGTPNTGGGAGGNRTYSAGSNGGSGVVIIRYPSGYTVSETTSAQLTFNTYTEGSDKVTVFTGGDGTIEFTT
jgi:Fe-S cluster assembly iron-binding protein IscA